MEKVMKIIFFLFLIVGGGVGAAAQNLFNGPECVAFDSLRNRYLVTNVGDGHIVEVSADGTQSYWGEWHPVMALGCVIDGNTFYYSSGESNVIGLDLETGLETWVWASGLGMGVDGLAVDTSGYLYVVGRLSGSIRKIKISDKTTTELVSSGQLPDFPQELYYDARYDQLVVCSWSLKAPIVAVSVKTGEITTLTSDDIAWRDGVTMDPEGNIYTASEVYGVVTMFDGDFVEPPVTIIDGLSGPSGLEYNWRDDILAIPVSDVDAVIFLSMVDTDDDGVIDILDNCPGIINSDQSNSDNDTLGDACDNCQYVDNDDQLDTDGDLIGDACDNCPEHYNPGQEDSNGNDIGDPCDYICGDTDGDRTINILDIVYLINYIYKSGPASEPLESADVNHDLSINILDIVYLINNIYKDGPDPVCEIW